MKTNRVFITVIALSFALVAAMPAIAQVGVGVGVGSQTKVGVGGGGAAAGAGTQAGVGAGAQAGGTKAGVGTNTGVQAGASAKTKSGSAAASEPKGPVASSADFVSRIESNSELSGRVHSMLPAGSTISSAAAGFKNEGQFLAALHASQNLNIPFDQLKAKMTGSSATSLGAAIKASKPDLSENQAKQEAKKAESEAKASAAAKAAASTKANSTASTAKPSGQQ